VGASDLEDEVPLRRGQGACVALVRAGARGQAREAAAIRPFLLRRRKEQVASDLPPRVESTLPVTLSHVERERYEEIRRAALRDLVSEESPRDAAHIFQALLRLRQISLDSRLAGRRGAPGAKTQAVIQHVEELLSSASRGLDIEELRQLLLIGADDDSGQ
jgi:SNF2 family DNA or RNA helicase